METLLVLAQSCVFLLLAYWSARGPKVWRWLGGLIVTFLIFDGVISLIDLALIGDALPGGLPTPLGVDPNNHGAILEYGVGLSALATGWIIGMRARNRVAGKARAASGRIGSDLPDASVERAHPRSDLSPAVIRRILYFCP